MSQHGKPGPAPAFDHDPSDPPPAYTARPYAEASSVSAFPAAAGQPVPAGHASPASLIRGLSHVLAANRDTRAADRSREDGEILRCLTSQAADFLADVSTWLSSPSEGPGGTTRDGRLEAELYLAPEGAFTESGWHSSGARDRAREGVHVREVRVQLPKQEKAAGDEKPRSSEYMISPEWSSDFTGEPKDGRLWWDDELEAHRLARCLEAEIKGPEDLSRREVMRNVKSPKSSKKLNDGASPNADSIRTTARAELMTFRRENEMGLWESQSGWTIVLTLHLST